MRSVFIVVFLLVSISAFAEVQVRDGKVTAKIQSELLRDVVNQIGTQAGITVSIDDSIGRDMVYANFEGLTVGAAIRKLLEGTDVNFAVIGNADGSPTAIFVSRSSSPGAPPKKLDARPVTSPGRGVVQPMSPPPNPTPVRQPPITVSTPNNNNPAAAADALNRMEKKPDQKPAVPTAGDLVPTAGSFTGPPPNQPNQPQMDKPLVDQNNAANDDGDDDDDDDDDDE
jgi:type II secretory pathway component GspD/PulD (secretin)